METPARELHRGRGRTLPGGAPGADRGRRRRLAPGPPLRRALRPLGRPLGSLRRPRRRARRRGHDARRQPLGVGAGDARLLADGRRRPALQPAAAPQGPRAAGPRPRTRSCASARRATSASCPTASPTWTWTTSPASSTRTSTRRPPPRWPTSPPPTRRRSSSPRARPASRAASSTRSATSPARNCRRSTGSAPATARSPGARRRRAGRSRPATPSSPPGSQGAVAVLHDGRFDPAERLRLCEELGVNVLCQAPTEYRMLAKRGELAPVPGLRRMVSAGEPIEPDVIRLFRERLGLGIGDGYGQTETGAVSGVHPDEDDPERDGSMGRPAAGNRDPDRRRRAAARAASSPTFFARYLDGEKLRGRVVADRRPGSRGRGRLSLVRGPRRRPDPLLRLPDRPLRGRVGAGLAPGRRRGGRRRRPRPRARLRRPRDRRPPRRQRPLGAARGRAAGPRQGPDRPLQVPAHRRVRRGAAEDQQRQDQAGGAARAVGLTGPPV